MQDYDIDFHIHSKYSKGVSKSMELPVIAKQAELKGLDMVGTGDALCIPWMGHIKKALTKEEDGAYSTEDSKTQFLVTAEVEDERRVHHLILFPSISSAEEMTERLRKQSNDIHKEGRPHVKINGEQLVDHAREVDALVGPAHAFTPWTAIYKEYSSLKECYGTNTQYVKFLELGLSADTYMADRISELQDITFLSNSDTHSPWPQRLGREFNRLLIDRLSFKEIADALERKNKRKFSLNLGLNQGRENTI